MQIKNLEVTEIVLQRVDSKTHKLFLQINFSNETSLPMEITLEENFELLIDKLIKQIKATKKPAISYGEDFLSGVSIVNIQNEEDIKERAPKRLYLLDRRLDNLKQTKNYKSYMDQYTQLSTLQDLIYQKGNSE